MGHVCDIVRIGSYRNHPITVCSDTDCPKRATTRQALDELAALEQEMGLYE